MYKTTKIYIYFFGYMLYNKEKSRKVVNNLKKSAKALLGTAGAFFGCGLVMNSLVLTRNSKKISEKMNEIEEKKNPKDLNSPKEILRAEGDAWVDSKGYDHIVIKNKKNEPIHALVVKADEESDKWLICIHGYTSSPKGMGSHALHYHARGFNVLFPCLRGHDISEHRSITMGWLDRLDILDWIQYISTTYNDPQIVLHGVSMGAATVMMTTGEELPANVKCAVADCGYSSVWDEFKNEMKQTYHVPAFPILYASNLATNIVSGFDFKKASSVEQLKKSKTPTIFIHGEKDAFVPYRMLDLNYNAAACEKEKLSIPDAEHAESHLVHPEIYWDAVFKFVDKYVK